MLGFQHPESYSDTSDSYIKTQRFVPLTTLSKVNSSYYKSICIQAQRFVPLPTLSKVNSNHYKSIYIKAQRFAPLATFSKSNSNYYKSIYIKAQRFVPLSKLYLESGVVREGLWPPRQCLYGARWKEFSTQRARGHSQCLYAGGHQGTETMPLWY